MWCLETIKQVNQAQAKGMNAFEAYQSCGIRVLGNSSPASNQVVEEEEIVVHTTAVRTVAEAAREWDAITKPTTRTMVQLPHDLEG